MARDVETNGRTVAQHMTGFSQLLAGVGMRNRDTFRRLIGGVSLSISRPADTDRMAEKPVDTAKELRPRRAAKGSTSIRIPGFLEQN